MILGIGSDLVDIRRIENSLTRYGKRFENRIFTPAEQQYAKRNKNADIKAMASTYAKRFAAKEACYKALNIGRNNNVSWQDIEVIKNANGATEIKLSGAAKLHLQTITPRGTEAKIFVSLSDEHPYAQAFVIIDTIPIS
jgi:holo-[acyl-carrier protein] synthase